MNGTRPAAHLVVEPKALDIQGGLQLTLQAGDTQGPPLLFAIPVVLVLVGCGVGACLALGRRRWALVTFAVGLAVEAVMITMVVNNYNTSLITP